MKGTYTINKFKAEWVDGECVPGEFIETLGPFENTITAELAIQAFCADYANGRGDSQIVCAVSELTFKGARTMEGADALYSVKGAVNVNAFWTASAGATDPFWTIDSLIAPPGAGTRQIRTVYFTSSYGGATDDVWSIVNLSTPCPQTNLEILQIVYKITLDRTTLNAEGNMSTLASEHFFRYLWGTVSAPAFAPVVSYVTPYDKTRWGSGIKQSVAGLYTNTQSVSEFIGSGLNKIEGTVGETLAKHRIHSTTTTGQFGNGNLSNNNSHFCGFPLKGVSVGSFDGTYAGAYSLATITKGSDSSVQNTYGRSADTGSARPQFLNTGIISTSAASVNLVDKGDWIECIDDSYTMPYLYRITMETGGLTGVSTYKVKRRKLGRWHNNDVRWYPSGIVLPMMNAETSGATGQHMDATTATEVRHGQTIWQASDTDASTSYFNLNSPLNGWAGYITGRYVYPEFLTWDYTGITINSINSLWTNVDANTTPALNVTEVLQVATDGTDIYVADAATGLYKIERSLGDYNPSNFTITQLSPPGIGDATSCRGVFAKGGSVNGHPGGIVEVYVQRGGSNYAVGDTVTFVGANGSGATAEVGAVDADGAITSITVTAQGSGYIEDHIQAYISLTTGGLGASLIPIIGTGGNIWALFDDTAATVMYLAHMTHVGSNDYTSLNFDTTGDTITRTGGTDFLTDGFRPGQRLIVRTAEDAGNTGTFTITAVTSTVITVSENLTTNATDTQAQIFGESWEIMTETITDDNTSYSFDGAGNPDTITGSGGTAFDTQGFAAGMRIVISGSENAGENDGIFTIASVAGSVITLDSQDSLVTNAADTTATIALLTDFTITNYTSGTPGRTGFIGLVMDPAHADDRFMMLTPTTKVVNDGSTDISNTTSGWDWWSFANSTGTVAAGVTDRIRVAANTDSAAMSAELLGPLTVGPLSTSNHWVCNGKSELDTGYATWGSATAVTSATLGINRTYSPLRTSASFNISVACLGTGNNRQFRTCDDSTELSNGATSDSILLYDFGSTYDRDVRPHNLSSRGEHFGYLGKGMFGGVQTNNISSSAEPAGFYVWTCNGDGTLATEEAMAYGFWEEYGWNGTDWVLDNVSAKTTHGQVSFSGTGITITAATGAIVGAGFASTDWAGDGFLVGDIITIASSEDPTNNGQYVIESLSGTTLTVTPNKLPAVNTTSAPDTTATVVGDHALIDGLALSFDDEGGTAALVVNEYYDIHVYDGILKDNATRVVVDTYHTWAADDTGTNFATAVDSPSTTTTIPNADVGAVTNQPLCALYYPGNTATNAHNGFVAPGEAGVITANTAGIPFAHKLDASSDFVVRFKASGCYADTSNPHDVHFGVVPWATIIDGTDTITTGELDENIQIQYDKDFPTHDQYTIRVRNTGNGADQLVYAANRVVLIESQDETDYDGAGSNGTFVGGDGAGGDAYVVNDVITMNDGSQITVDAIDGNGDVTQFTVTVNSTKSSGNSQIGLGANDYTSLDFNTTGNVITRTGGTAFTTDGYQPGMKIIIDAAADVGNNGVYEILSVTATTLVTVENLSTNNAADATAQINHAIVQASVTPSAGRPTNFALIPGTNNLIAADVANDEFSMHRTGTAAGNTSWRLNGVQFYAYAGALHTATDMGLCFHCDNTRGVQIYDATIDYELNGRFLRVGNASTTGTLDPNFRCITGSAAGTDLLRLYYNAGSGPVEFGYNIEGYTVPAANEVTFLSYAGLLWFNTANATDTITGNWTITKIDNMT